MDKFKLISAFGEEKFQESIDKWTDNNLDKKILGIQHSSCQVSENFAEGTRITGIQFSALIWFA